MTKKEYKVVGMHCIGCSMGISKLLKKQKGVSEVDMELQNSKFYITYDENQINNELIIETVGRLGYKAVLEEK
jgi:copper chaperone CopZ